MANQKPSDKVDRNGGGDATKAERVAMPKTDVTSWESLGGDHGDTSSSDIVS